MVQKPTLKPAGRGSQTKPQPKSKPPAPSRKTGSQPASHPTPVSGESTNTLPTTAQQRLLDIFSHAFQEVLSSPTFTSTLQEVKQALFDRDFERAFGKEEYLEVYAARWSPTRALCYASVLAGIRAELASIASRAAASASLLVTREEGAAIQNESTETSAYAGTLKVLAIGGGAAEIVALGSFLSQARSEPAPRQLETTLLDSGPWSDVVAMLERGLTTPQPLSKYASAAARAANHALVSVEAMRTQFVQGDVLTMDTAQISDLSAAASGRPCLVTLLFTLNELFTAGGLGPTTTFLLNLTAVLPPGSLLLVVDSPGSYSETSVGSHAKKYPMQWLLEKVLLEETDNRTWMKLQSRDSVWFRLAAELRYPIALEDMRYQMHLYKLEDMDTKAIAGTGDI
jgi:25S rRNA (uracil2843-N3)-methyltransferase